MPDQMFYSAATPRLALPLLFAGQAQKEATVNEALSMLDLAVGAVVQGVRSTVPSGPQIGQMWLVGQGGEADFATHDGHLAGWTEGGWRFIVPFAGMCVHDLEAGAMRLFDGSWKIAAVPSTPSGGSFVDGEARAAITALIASLQSIGVFPGS
ncbi:MAG: DUF2793 domain-containing protein [Novosphingobium meiothermophilum]